nr:putative ribonuclease H-like domain-containing protein [Tanacetum cinerariifolium]
MPWGCLLELGKVGEMMGSSVRVVEWTGKEGEWRYGAWREKQFGVDSNPFKTGGKMILFSFWGFYKVSPWVNWGLTRKSLLLYNATDFASAVDIEINDDDMEEMHDYPHRDLKDKGIIDSGCSRITSKGKIKAGKLDFEDVYYVEELKHYNLFSVSQMCDKKNKVLFTDTDYLVLSPYFKLPDENQVLLKIPRQHNMYSFNLKNINPSGDLACLFTKALIDKSNKWYRRLGHVNFKNLNKLVKGNLVRGLPFEIFKNDHTCVACEKGKQHKASCKAKTVSSVNQPLQILHMDLFRPTSAETVNTACYVLNRVLVTKPQNETPYEFLTGPKEANNSVGTQANDDQGANSEEINLHEED